METKQLSTHWTLHQGSKKRKRNKYVLEFNENEGIIYPNFWDTVKAMPRVKFRVPNCLHKEVGEILYQELSSTLESCRTKRRKDTQKGVNKIETNRKMQRITEIKICFFEK